MLVRSALLLSWLGILAAPAQSAAGPPAYTLFESGHVRPLALSHGGQRLFALNTPDNRLEIFDSRQGTLRHRSSVRVGLEPVAVAVHPNGLVWVVNHLSDSVSIVDVESVPPRVIRTLQVGDEPNDIVFAGSHWARAFVTTAHRGAHSPTPRGDYDRAGIGRADVFVFDANAASPTDGSPLAVLTLFGDKPRALAASPDGSRVYAAIFRSGNRTTTASRFFVCTAPKPCVSHGVRAPGGLPAPTHNLDGEPGPLTGLIVRSDPDSSAWTDELGRDWSDAIRFSLPDLDVFEIDALAAPPIQTRAFSGVGTVLYNMAVNPLSGAIYVSNTEARNEIRFEGAGALAGTLKPPGEPPSVRGRLHQARITVIDGDAVQPHHLNPHIPYGVSPVPADVKAKSLATPLGMAVSSDGETLYLAAFGSNRVAVLDTRALEAGASDMRAADPIELPGGGPTGLVLDEKRERLYALTRFDNSVVSIDTRTRRLVGRAPLYSPEPTEIVRGRPFLYDATRTSSNGEASCAACHVFGDTDDLAWDLGNPDAAVSPNPNPPGDQEPFHPLKGPMMTQSLRGLDGHGPMHWRGDRTGGNQDPPADPLDVKAAFGAFRLAFDSLLGRDEGPLSPAEMRAFTDFALRLEYPPNPIRRLDNTLRSDEQRGRDVFFAGGSVGTQTCADCHAIERTSGRFGTNSLTRPGPLKVPHLRNAYQKVGMFGMPAVPLLVLGGNNTHRGAQIRGFGFTHDGAFDTVDRFLRLLTFVGFQSERSNLEAWVMAFESRFAPIVGQQVTLAAGSGPEAMEQADLLVERANTVLPLPEHLTARECDLVVHGVVDGATRAWSLATNGRFHGDRSTDTPLGDPQLRTLATRPGSFLTYTCMPPGSGRRAGIDRDLDGSLDGDERDAGSDPTDPTSLHRACRDGIDNDGDGAIDHPHDEGCITAHGHSERSRRDAAIDVVPGSACNPIPTHGWVRVALLGSESVDVRKVVTRTLVFGPGSARPVRLLSPLRLRDLNQDGDRDLLLTFHARDLRLRKDDHEACLLGEIDGSGFRACDRVQAGAMPGPDWYECDRGPR